MCWPGCWLASRWCWCWTTASIWPGPGPRWARRCCRALTTWWSWPLRPVPAEGGPLATSREPLGVVGEARYRLPPLTLPARDDPDGIPRSEAVALFADRARRADRQFSLNGDSAPAVARLVTRLDGMPLAIELAAARVEALGLAQLLDRLDDQFILLARADLAPGAARHR